MFLQALDCSLYLEDLSYKYDSLDNKYDNLVDTAVKEIKARDLIIDLKTDTLNSVRDTLKTTNLKLKKETNRKQNWRTIAIVEGGIIALFTTLTILLF